MQIPRLREWREIRALTQVELAEKAGVSERSVAGYEAGGGARPPTVRKLAEALGVEVADLRGEPARPKEVSRSSLEPSLFNGLEDERRNWRNEAEEFIAENRSLLQEERLSRSVGYRLLQRSGDRWWEAFEAKYRAEADEQFPLAELNDIALDEEMYGEFQDEVYKDLKRRFPDKETQDELAKQRERRRRGAA